MRLLVTSFLCLLLHASSLPLAMAPPRRPPGPTPACPATVYPDEAALLSALPGAGYACVEQIAAALRPLASPALADTLLHMAREGTHSRERRNAVRVLGRLAESPRGSRAAELVLRARAATVQATMTELLARETDNFLLQDAVWLIDSFFFPNHSAAPALEHVAAATDYAPALRYRAAAARARLVYAKPGPLGPADRAFILGGLRSDDAGVRAAAAQAAACWCSTGYTTVWRGELDRALEAAWAAEPPLDLAPDDPGLRDAGLLGSRESSPTSLTARAAIARAQDALAGGSGRLEELREAYEALALPSSLSEGGITVRSGLPRDELPALLDEVQRAQAGIDRLLGPGFATAIAGEGGRPLTMVVFARQGIYRDYARAFTPFAVDVDGTYDEATATIYTHQRTAAQSENALEETLRHELGHHVAATRLFPGQWSSPGYHGEPKGWADEGLAELASGLTDEGPRPRRRQLARLCAAPTAPDVASLLARRAGYDRFGSFDYDGAWALSYYLLQERPDALRRLYAAYRDGGYRLKAWEQIAGLSVEEAQAELGAALGRWCN